MKYDNNNDMRSIYIGCIYSSLAGLLLGMNEIYIPKLTINKSSGKK